MTIRPLRRILSVQAILVTIVPFTIVAVLLAILFLPQLKEDTETRHQELAQLIEMQIESYLNAALSDVKAISFLPMGGERFELDSQHLLDAQIDASKSLNLIYFANLHGRVSKVGIGFQHSDVMHQNLQGINLEENRLFKEAMQLKKPAWSDTFLSIIGSGLAVAVAVPTADKVVIGEIDLGRLTKFLKRTAKTEGQIILVIDSRGQVIADQQGSFTAQQLNLSNIPLIRNGLEAMSPLNGQFELNGRIMTGSMIKIPAFRWSILVAQPTEVVFRSYRSISIIIAAGLVSALLLGVTASLVMSRRLALKFELLAVNARKVADGNDATVWPQSNITEVCNLANDLQLMSKAISVRERQLSKSEQRLRLYFQRLPISSIVWGKDYRVQQWNPAAEKIFGYSANEAFGRTANELIIPDHVKVDTDKVWNMLLDGNFDAHHVNDNKTRHGNIITCAWTNTPYYDDQGVVAGVISVVEDITQRVIMEAALHKLSHAVEQSPVSIVITDVSGNIEYVNPKFTELTGYLREEVIGYNPRILKSGLTQAEEYQSLWDTITKGKSWYGELCNCKKNGELYWESAAISPIINDKGHITHFVAVKEDITEKKRIVDELLLDSVRFEVLYKLALKGDESEENLLDFVLESAVRITKSAIGYIYFINDDESTLTLHAWSKAVMKECSMPVKPTEYKVAETGLWGEAVRQRKPVITNDYAAPNPLKKGCPEGHVPIRSHMNVPLIENGKIVLIAGVGNKETPYNDTDVQQLTLLMSAMWRIILEKKTKKSLRESEDRFHQMFAQNDDAIILLRLKMLRILDANQAALTLFGVTHGQLSHLNPFQFFNRNEFRRFIKNLSRDSHDSLLVPKASGFRADGEKITVSIKGKIISLCEEKVILCHIRDISEKIRMIEEMQSAQAKMIQANKMTSIGLLVSGVGHEINNPNQCISTNATVLNNIWRDAVDRIENNIDGKEQFNLGGLSFAEVKQFAPQLFSGIIESSRKISAIISDMRDFVKEEKAPLKGAVNINKVIQSATSILWSHIHKYTENYKTELQEDLPMASGSFQQIEQVIINLIINALQSLPDKSRKVLLVTTSDLEAGELIVMVEDEGCGMSKQIMDKLKVPFYTTRPDKGGTGLGLYISENIIKDHGGSLSFVSQPGMGTTATIRLPVAN